MVSSSSSRAGVVVLVLMATSVALSYAGGEAGPKYGSSANLDNKLGPENRLCSDGKRQSPVDIVTKQAVPAPNLDSLNRTYAAVNGTLVNDGRGISMTFEGAKVGTITVNGKVYNLEKLQWHTPSEHTINGQRFPLELHVVHKSDAGDLAVIAILYKYGAPDSFYFQLKNKLGELGKDRCNPAEEESRVPTAGPVHLRSLQKRARSYFRYSGSLTSPPCTENVVWNVLGKVRQISKEQVALFEALPLPSSTSRPVQPLNGRTVQFYRTPINSTISSQM